MEKFKKGDKVKIIKKYNTWNSHGKMDKWLGKTVTIKSYNVASCEIEEDSSENNGTGWFWNHSCLELVESEKNMEKITEYQGKKYREVKRVAKVGEKIKIVDAYATNGKYGNGNILTVKSVIDQKGDTVEIVFVNEFDHPCILTSEYVVLEEINVIKEPEFTLADLKPGKHVVKIRGTSDKFGLVLDCGFSFEKSYMYKTNIANNLKHNFDHSLDIIEVFKIIDTRRIAEILKIDNLKSVWKRIEKSPTQLKIEEIENTVSELNKQLEELKKV